MVIFLGIFIMAVRGIRLVESGLDLIDLSPDSSYLRVYDQLYSTFFWNYDIPVYVFFPDPTPWWDPRVMRTLKVLDQTLKAKPSTRFLNDPLMRMIDDKDISPSLTTGKTSKLLLTYKQSLMIQTYRNT